ncbi:MAG: S8 family serine peptidase [Niastella sp.]|nr:S8 family serine peptidase [Niastella sp.]
MQTTYPVTSPALPGDTFDLETVNADRTNVIIELKGNAGFGLNDTGIISKQLEDNISSLSIDWGFEAIPVKSFSINDASFSLNEGIDNHLIKANVPTNEIPNIEKMDAVIKVWNDTEIAPFACPIPPCDCTPAVPKGAIPDVAKFLGVDKIWSAGFKGKGIVVAVVDGGITAVGRPVGGGETPNRIPNVIDGWPVADWGTTAKNWSEHGNMCSTDVLGMAPDAEIFDIRISGPAGTSATVSALISNAIAGYQWCINKFKATGTPQIMSNSWGIYQSSWDPVYATNRAHPFTRKVEEALNAGIIILFAAGNCGDTCPDSRCGADVGPRRSIWGANGHPRVMTVGAVNKNSEFVGYSSQGPAALDPQKPDFCSVTHFKGYFPSDSGTSAATPVAAGVVALFKESKPMLTQPDIKTAIMSTAKDIGPIGWDNHSGAGILQAKSAFDSL